VNGRIIRDARPDDAEAIAAIYAPYVERTPITFELIAPGAVEIARRMASVMERHPWLVAEENGRILGYAYADLFRSRAAYRWVVETTVYVAMGDEGRGIGRALYAPLLDRLSKQGYVATIGAIALPNPASVALHEAMGFVHAGTYSKVGYKLDAWHDVGIWQRELGPRPEHPAEPLSPDRREAPTPCGSRTRAR
jgi:phosphinothricin acetyltransferase